MSKPKIELEGGTLAIQFYDPTTDELMYEFQALTQGGWVLQNYSPNAKHSHPQRTFGSRRECIQYVEEKYEVEEM